MKEGPFTGAVLGIDLSSDARETAACLMSWDRDKGTVEKLLPDTSRPGPLTDPVLIDLIGQVDRVGIDAPFGWPVRFVDAVVSWRGRDRWPQTSQKREELRYRTTDLELRGKPRLPLSVSSDRLAVTAMRCAALLQQLMDNGSEIDRSGRRGVAIEVYPATALYEWGLDPSGYKGTDGEKKRRALVDRMTEVLRDVCALDNELRAACIESDHVLDALVAALVTRAAQCGHTSTPAEGAQRELAEVEGWIHVPAQALPAALRRQG